MYAVCWSGNLNSVDKHKYIYNIKMGHTEIGVSNYQLLKEPLPHGDSKFRIINGNKEITMLLYASSNKYPLFIISKSFSVDFFYTHTHTFMLCLIGIKKDKNNVVLQPISHSHPSIPQLSTSLNLKESSHRLQTTHITIIESQK
jgi:hypothetical protein